MRRFWEWLKRLVPFGLLFDKPRHYREMLVVLWENRGNWGYAWRILRHGVCDGCSLGPRGLRDDVIPGVHLCLTRLKLLRLNTMSAIPDEKWGDIAKLRAMTNEQLHHLGRVPYPLWHAKGSKGFVRIGWDEAIKKVADGLRASTGERLGFFASSRGLTNETYYTFQKLGRIAGTSHIDSCARLCHAASTTALKETLGWGAPTCSLKDLIGTDLVILFGTDLPNNQPVSTKYLHFAKKAGTRIIVVNPFKEPALERYWVPSVASSALFGTKLMDDFYGVAQGGDIAFITGALKALDASGAVDKAFISEHTAGFDAMVEKVRAATWPELEKASGLSREDMERFAATYAKSRHAIIVYSMGLTQHRFGVDNVRAICNLALARGNVGREKTGIIPIRGHSGVQGTAECGVDPEQLPGGIKLSDESAARLEGLWGHAIPRWKGLKAAHLLDRAGETGLDVLYTLGGNYLDTMPDPKAAAHNLGNVKLRVHQDILINTSALVEPLVDGGGVLMLPAQTRYEQSGGGTSTTTERRVRFTPEIAGPRIGETKPEWEIPALIGRALKPDQPALFAFPSSQSVRDEMEKTMPLYAGIGGLKKEGEFVQWGGERLGAGGIFKNLPDNRARFCQVPIPNTQAPEGLFVLASRRGKQFNSITYGQRDGVTKASTRKAVFFSAPDAQRLGLHEGDPVRLSNALGSMDGVCTVGPVREGHLQAFWPECNVLIDRRYDPQSGEPDYNAFVRVEQARP
jgi:molybdopterin-dependent oxidoreductase alpha subunit